MKVHEDMLTGCWIWRGSTNSWGYGVFWYQGRRRKAHAVAYEMWVGPIPAGRQLDHFACDNPRCVNPWHVRPVTARENILRSRSFAAAHASTTHCPQGHPYDEENTIWTRKGTRRCRICRRQQGRDFARRRYVAHPKQLTHCQRCGERFSRRKNGRQFCAPCKTIEAEETG